MSRPSGFADLAGLRVGIWGYGVEGAAAHHRIVGLAASIVLVDDAPRGDDVLATTNGGHAALLRCDVVLKSPGVPRRRADVLELEAAGVHVTSALNLWLHDVDRSRVIAVTGTKGKSTTTSLITYVVRALGDEAVAAGNIGQPPYEPDFAPTGWIVLEVSSYQAVDLDVAPRIVVVTSLGADHVDWHGSLSQYQSDKLSLTRTVGEHITFVADDEALRLRSEELGGEVRFVDDNDHALTDSLGLIGRHNAGNVALALAVAAQISGRTVDEIADVVRANAESFEPLPGRLTLVRTIGDVRYIDDGLATAPLPAVAALEAFSRDPVAIIVGGYDRGVDYTALAEALARRSSPTTVVAMPDAGSRIIRTIRERAPIPFVEVDNMSAAVAAARDSLNGVGVVLMSPAAPSFGHYANWRERSDDFVAVVHAL